MRELRRPVQVAIVDDDEINRRGMASLLAEHPDVEVVASLRHAEALEHIERWDGVDVVLVDAADERRDGDQFPGVAVVEHIRRRRSWEQTLIVVITGHFFNDAVRRRMREARADFYYHRAEVADSESLCEAVLHPEQRVPEPAQPDLEFSLGVTDHTRVNRAVGHAGRQRLQELLATDTLPRRAWQRVRREFNGEARLTPVTTDGRRPDRHQVLPSRPQILRFLAWATRVRPGELGEGAPTEPGPDRA